MRRFKWIEWNVQKIAAHGLSAEEPVRPGDRDPHYRPPYCFS